MKDEQLNPSVIPFTQEHYSEVGINFRKRREELGLTQEQVAGMIGTDPRNIRLYEHGRSLTLGNFIVLLQVLKCTVADIFPEEFLPLVSIYNKLISNISTDDAHALASSIMKDAS